MLWKIPSFKWDVLPLLTCPILVPIQITSIQSRSGTKPTQQKKTVPDKMNVNGIPLACLRLSQLNVKCVAWRGDRAALERELAGVSCSITLLLLSSLWCWTRGSMAAARAAGSNISERVKNEASAQGNAEEAAKPHGHYFKIHWGDNFCRRGLLHHRWQSGVNSAI